MVYAGYFVHVITEKENETRRRGSDLSISGKRKNTKSTGDCLRLRFVFLYDDEKKSLKHVC